MIPLLRLLAVLALSAGLAACTQVYTASPGPSGGGSAPSGPRASGGGGASEDDDPFEDWDEVLEDTEAREGYFRTHRKRDNTLYLEIPADRLDEEFGLVLHFDKGVGVFNAHDGLRLSSTQLMRFERRGDDIFLVRVNPLFTAEPGSAMEASLEENVGHSVVHAFDIESEHDESGALLVDATPFLVSDYARVGDQLQTYYGRTNRVSFQRDRSHVDRVAGFPENVEIGVFLTYGANDPPAVGGSGAAGVSDWRSVPIGVRYSIFALPEVPMERRAADDRVGYFLSAERNFSRDREDSPYVRWVHRWRLEKEDPSAEMSEPVEPIVFYIDRTVPERYREYVRAGIENWNKAFEAAGFRNAIVARQAPTEAEDSTWSAEDIRYSTVRWSAAHQMGYAIGPSQVDPRTGEILNADILISSIFVSGYRNDWERLAGPDGMLARWQRADELGRTLPSELSPYLCVYEMGRSHQMGFQRLALTALGELSDVEPMPDEFLGPSITDLIMHEVGHTLGLRHNMKGSSAIPFERLDDEDYTEENGLTLSVMEYGAVNINPDRDAQGHYVNREVGAYDVWAIRYGYAPLEASGEDGEAAALDAIAGASAEELHTYGTDEDLGFGGWGVDPHTNTWDLSADPLRWARQRAELVEMVKPQLDDRVVSEGEPWADLRSAMNGVMFERFGSLLPLTKVVGGLYFHRDHRGQPGQRPPFVPVDASRQREAVDFLVEQAFAEDAWTFESERLNHLAPNRYSDFANNVFGAFPIDYAVHAQVAGLQGALLASLLDNARMARVIDNELRMGGREAYALAELMATVTDAAWSELLDSPARAPSSFRRNLQRAWIDRMGDILLSEEGSPLSPPAPEDARSLARHHLRRITARIDEVLDQGAPDDMTRAHLEESRARITRMLEASMTYRVEG